jgi:hypothetical protein
MSLSESSSPRALEPDDLGVEASLLAAESKLFIVAWDKLLNEPFLRRECTPANPAEPF